ncbi:hypothetical protein Riv7116_0990 [Rivularia sp. PCC 7116]|nr:hypothetical protein Riv7116_0990 [Rivularia sp. PCC 7116]
MSDYSLLRLNTKLDKIVVISLGSLVTKKIDIPSNQKHSVCVVGRKG